MTISFKVNDTDARGRPLSKPERAVPTTQEFLRAFGVQLRGQLSPYRENAGARKNEAPVSTVEACGVNAPNVCDGWRPNGLLAAVDSAFNNHYPLTLGPDDIWLAIAQGFALHVNANAEALRGRFVQHEGKKELLVVRDSFVKGSPDNDWQGVFGEFSDQIAEHIGKQRDLVVASFSTTGLVERAASEVVLMDAMKNYFEYRVSTCCGIPEITLLGTKQDWENIRQRAAVLAEYDLGWWVDPLVGILDQFIAAASGKADRKFWQSIYHESGGSGGPFVTGWIQVFFPYVENWRTPGSYTLRNENIVKRASESPPFAGHGPTPDAVPPGLSKVDFKWSYYAEEFPMEFIAGFIGFTQDPTTFAVRPAIGWAVRDRPVVEAEKVPETVDRSFVCHKCQNQLSAKPPKEEGEVEVVCPKCGQKHFCSAKEVAVYC